MTGTTRSPIAAASGAAAVVLMLAGNSVFAGAGEDPTGEQVIAAYSAAEAGTRTLGIGLELAGFVAFAFFVAYLHRILRATAGAVGWRATVALIGGVLFLAVKVASGSALVALAGNGAALGPDLALLLLALNDGAFVMGWLALGLFLTGTAAAALPARALPRTMSVAGLVIGIAAVAATATLGAGPGVLTFLLSLLWIVATSSVLTRRELRGPVREPIREPVGDPAWSVEV